MRTHSASSSPVPSFSAKSCRLGGLILAAGLLLLPLGRSFGQILFESDLSNEDPGCWLLRPSPGCNGWVGIRDDKIVSLAVNGVSHSGNKSMKIVFTKNEQYGGATRVVNTQHIFTRYYDYYEMGFDFAAGMKVHRISGFNSAKGLNDFDIIVYSAASHSNFNYCGLSEPKFMRITFNGGPVDWGGAENAMRFQRGKWYLIETEVKLNEPGKSNGLVRMWVDGKLFAEKTGINIVGNQTTQINRVLFGGWYSNSHAGKNPCVDPVSPSIRYIDDMAIGSSRIGPVGGAKKRPRPPTNLPARDYDPIPD